MFQFSFLFSTNLLTKRIISIVFKRSLNDYLKGHLPKTVLYFFIIFKENGKRRRCVVVDNDKSHSQQNEDRKVSSQGEINTHGKERKKHFWFEDVSSC